MRKKSLRKSRVFWSAFWSLIVLYLFTAIYAPAALPSVGPAIVVGIAAAGGFYQASDVMDNRFRGQYYRPELDDERRIGQ